MKKLLVVSLTLILLAAISLTAFAADNNFVSSRALEQAPELVSFLPSASNTGTQNSNNTLKIVPFGKRDTLTPDLKANIENAYEEISGKQGQSQFNGVINNLAKNKNLKPSNIAVSNLFDIHTEDENGNIVSSGDYYTLTLSSNDAKNFAGLIKRNSDGTWELVSDAKVDGNKLSFTFTGSAPYAILVNNTANTVSPTTGDSNVNVILLITVFSALVFSGVILSSKKQNA